MSFQTRKTFVHFQNTNEDIFDEIQKQNNDFIQLSFVAVDARSLKYPNNNNNNSTTVLSCKFTSINVFY